jgi:hypothetical protein
MVRAGEGEGERDTSWRRRASLLFARAPSRCNTHALSHPLSRYTNGISISPTHIIQGRRQDVGLAPPRRGGRARGSSRCGGVGAARSSGGSAQATRRRHAAREPARRTNLPPKAQAGDERAQADGRGVGGRRRQLRRHLHHPAGDGRRHAPASAPADRRPGADRAGGSHGSSAGSSQEQGRRRVWRERA